MNPTLEVLLNRRSVRQYSEQPLSNQEEELILQATLRAPTAGNMMLYSIIIVEDQGLKDRLAITCDNQPFIAKAPFVLLFAADYQRWYDFYLASGVDQLCQERGWELRNPQEGDLMLACCDTLIAAHTAVIAAESMGIGSCYIGDILEHFEEHQKLFNLPQYVLPISLITFGYPAGDVATRKLAPRFGSEFIVHKNTYRQMGSADLEKMMADRNQSFSTSANRKDGIDNVGKFNYVRKFNADFSHEMTSSVSAMIKSWCTRP